MKKSILNKNSNNYKELQAVFFKNYKALEENMTRFTSYIERDIKDNLKATYKKEISSAKYGIHVLKITFYDLFKQSIVSYKQKNNIKVNRIDY